MRNFDYFVTPKLIETILPVLPHSTGQTVQMARLKKNVQLYREFLISSVQRGLFESVLADLIVLIEKTCLDTGYRVDLPTTWTQMGSAHPTCAAGKESLLYVVGSLGLLADCIVLAICVELMYSSETKLVREPFMDVWQEMKKSNLFESAAFFHRAFRLINVLGAEITPLRSLPPKLCHKILKTIMRISPQTALAAFVLAPKETLRTSGFVVEMLTEYTRLITYFLWQTNPKEVTEYVDEAYRRSLPKPGAGKGMPPLQHDRVYIDADYRFDLLATMGPSSDRMAQVLDKTRHLLMQTPTTTQQQLLLYFLLKNLHGNLILAPNVKDEWPIQTLRSAEELYRYVKQNVRYSNNVSWNYNYLTLSALLLVIPFDDHRPLGTMSYNPVEFSQLWREKLEMLDSPEKSTRQCAVLYFTNLSGLVWLGCQNLENAKRYEHVARWMVDIYPKIKAELFDFDDRGRLRAIRGSKVVLSRFFVFYSMWNPEELINDCKGLFDVSPGALHSLLSCILFAHTIGAPSIWATLRLWEDEIIRLLELYALDSSEREQISQRGLVLVYGLTLFIRSSRFAQRIKRENTLRLMEALVKLMKSQIAILLDKTMEFMICTMKFLSQGDSLNESAEFFGRVYELISGLMAHQTSNLLKATVHEDLSDRIDHFAKFMQLRLEAGSRLYELGIKRATRLDASSATELRAAVLRCLCTADHRTVMRALDSLRILHKGMSMGMVECEDETQASNMASDYALVTEIVHSDAYQLQSAAVAHKCMINFLKAVESPGATLQILYDSLMITWRQMLEDLDHTKELDPDAQRRMMILHKFIFIMHTMWLNDANPELQQRSEDRIYEMVMLVLSPNHYARDLTFSCLSLRLGLPSEYLNRILQLIGKVASTELIDNYQNSTLDKHVLLASLTRLVASAQQMIEHIYNDTSNMRVVIDDSIVQVTDRVLKMAPPIFFEAPATIVPSLERVLGTVISIGKYDDLFMTKKTVLVGSLLKTVFDIIEKLSDRYFSRAEELAPTIAKALDALTDGYSFDIAPEGPTPEQYENFLKLIKSVDSFRTKLSVTTDSDQGAITRNIFQHSLTNLFSSNIELAYLVLFDDAFLADADLRIGLYNAFAISVEEEQDTFVQMASKYAKLGDYLLENREVLFAMCDTCSPTDAESLAELLLLFFDGRNHAFEVVQAVARLEISRQKDCCDTFRQNSVLTKIVITYMAMKMSDFLTARLKPVVNRILKSRYVFMNRKGDKSDALMQCRNFVSDLEAHQDEIPMVARKFARFIYNAVEDRFEGYGLVALNNIFLLRCVCPAIVSPDRYDMMERPPLGGVLTSLLRSANSIQKYCSHSSPDTDLRDRMRNFFLRMIDVDPEYREDATLPNISHTNLDQVNFSLHLYLYRHVHEIRSACLSSVDFDMEKFTTIHRTLGRPTSISLLNTKRRRSKAWSARSGSTRQFSRSDSVSEQTMPSIKTYMGLPCFILSADMSVAHKNLVLSRFVSFQQQVNDEFTQYCMLQDLTLPSITFEHWIALSDVVYDAMPSEFMSRFKNVVLNLPYNIAHLSRDRRILSHPLKAYTYKTYYDMDISVMEELEVRDITLQYAHDFSTATLFERTTVQHHGELLQFDIYVGKEAVHMRYQGMDFTSMDVVPLKRVHLDKMNFRIRLQANQGSFATTYVIEQQPSLYRKISSLKARAQNHRKCENHVMHSAYSDHTGALMFLALVDLCDTESPIWAPAYKLWTALSASMGVRMGPGMISGTPHIIRKMQVRAVAAASKHLVKVHPDTSGIVRMFTKMLLSDHSDLHAASRVVAPWLSHLARVSLGQDKEVDALLVAMFGKMCESQRSCQVLCFSLLPHIERSETATILLADALMAFIVHRRMRGETTPEWVIASVASVVSPSITENIFKHILALTNVDVGYEITNWNSHPNWFEIEVELTFLSYVRIDASNLDESLPLFLMVILGYSGVGLYQLRLAQHRNFLNVVDALMSLPGLDDFATRRLKSLWDELHTPRCQTLFAIQDETKDSSYNSLTDFTFHQAEQLGRLVYELYSTGAIIFRPVHELRRISQNAMLRLSKVVFPAFQRRCIFGLCVVHRFEVPDETYQGLIDLLLTVLRDCKSPETLLTYCKAIFMALSKLILGVSRSSPYKPTLKIFILSFLWHHILPAYPEALPMFTSYMLINDYAGEIDSEQERLELLVKDFEPHFGVWWNKHLVAPVPTAENLAIIVNDLFIFGLQHSDSQNVAMAAVETVSYQMTSRDWRRQTITPTLWLPFAATMFLVCQDVNKLQTIPVLTNFKKGEALMDNETILEEMTKCLASYLNKTTPSTIVTLAQCCSLTGHTSSMSFMHAGPRLLNLLSYVENADVISLICPLLRPTMLRLLELDDPEMNARVLEWTQKLVKPRPDKNWGAQLHEILTSSGFGYLVDENLNLLPEKPHYKITEEIRESLIGLCDSFFSALEVFKNK